MSNCPDCGEVLISPKSCAACGWKRGKGEAIEPWPKLCMWQGCQEDTAIVWARARKDGGDEIRVNGGKVLYHDRDGLKVRVGFEFIGWITRCVNHYDKEFNITPEGLEKLRTDHPELFPKIESEDDKILHADMHLNYMRQEMKKIGNRLPYKKHERLVDKSEEALTGHIITPEQIAQTDTSKYVEEA